jgi:hypothetical protein
MAFAEPDAVQRVMDAAEQAGLGERVHASADALDSFTPAEPLTAVIYTQAAFVGLSAAERARVIQVLQSATADWRRATWYRRLPASGLQCRSTNCVGAIAVGTSRSRESAPNSFMARKGIA